MRVARVSLLLRLHAASSLKEKRSVLQSVKRKLRQRFNVAVAEVGEQDRHRMARLGLATVGADGAMAEAEAEAILRWLDGDVRFEVVERELELL